MSTQFLEHMEKHITSARPKALELRELKKQRERIRKEEIAKVLEKYKEIAQNYPELEIFLSKKENNTYKIFAGIAMLSLIASITSAIITFTSIMMITTILIFIISTSIFLSENEACQFLKIKSNKTELVVASNDAEELAKLTAIDIEAAIESWLLEQEEKEIEDAEPDDIEKVYK